MKRTLMLVVALSLSVGSGGCDGTLLGSGGGDDDDGTDPTDPIDPDDGHSLLFFYGPMKLMPAEAILYSIEAITGHDFGDWDHTTPEPGSQAFADSGNGAGTFYVHCRLLGGCMEHRIPQGRTSFVGTAFVLELEKAAVEACYDRAAFGMFPGDQAPAADALVVDVINHLYVKALGAPPDADDLALSIAYFEAHLADPEFTDVSPLESAGRGHCRALLSTNRFLFY